MRGLDLIGADEGGLIDAGAGMVKGLVDYFKKPDAAAIAKAEAAKAEAAKPTVKKPVVDEDSGLSAYVIGPVRVWHALLGVLVLIGGVWYWRKK